VLIAGGGTGGHLTPALALGRALVARGCEVLLVGAPRGPDREILPASGLPYRIMAAPALERRRWWRNVWLPGSLAAAVVRARRLVAEFRPHVAVGTGGYVMVPVMFAARRAGVPIVLQEQNRVPGLATRLAARWARRVCVQFAESGAALKKARVEVTGSPIAPPVSEPAEFAARLDPARPTIGVFGGSQGARALNDAVIALAGPDPAAAPFNLVWQTGAADHARAAGAAAWPERFVVRPFFTPMAAVYPLLDLIVCRAGAMTLAEVTAWGIPSILVPYPLAAGDHQTRNARAVEATGAGVVIPQESLAGALPPAVAGLLADGGRRDAMARAARQMGRPDAALRVAEIVLDVAREAA
jgi:UDP-N-acetylglucosamine--N-acetylmuramyl-(pentapeptide) pyrophosphoryl-undecaprenol N-acetylglucosamine transferase